MSSTLSPLTPTLSPRGEREKWATVLAWIIVGLCCVLPVVWIVSQIALNPATLSELRFDSFRAALLGRTLLYNIAVGLIATLIALPAAWVLGRGRGFFAAALWYVLPISLLCRRWCWRMAGNNCFDCSRLGIFDPARVSRHKPLRLVAWRRGFGQLPAIIIGLGLRKSDPQVQQQAMLDGVLGRVILRQVIGPIVASVCIVSMLAMQEFAVYEPTGISVIATEVRMVFETGAFSSPDNPITQFFGASSQSQGTPDQPARAAAAIATALPMLAVVVVLGCIAILTARKLTATENVEAGPWPATLDAPRYARISSWMIVLVTWPCR